MNCAPLTSPVRGAGGSVLRAAQPLCMPIGGNDQGGSND